MNADRNFGLYARLGNACQTSLSCLLSNTKYLGLNAPVYQQGYTTMAQYPGPPTNIKDRQEFYGKSSQENSSGKGGCCRS
jgi:hypothetical protein